jgi:hypothetical protein
MMRDVEAHTEVATAQVKEFFDSSCVIHALTHCCSLV